MHVRLLQSAQDDRVWFADCNTSYNLICGPQNPDSNRTGFVGACNGCEWHKCTHRASDRRLVFECHGQAKDTKEIEQILWQLWREVLMPEEALLRFIEACG